MRERKAVPRGSTESATPRETARRDRGGSAEKASWKDEWLSQSEGFRVDSPDGRIGLVEAVLVRSGRPETLVVRAGLLGRRLLLVSTENVEEVAPRRKRIVLCGSPRLVGGEPRAETQAS